jgi:hypothetical protein
LKYCSRSAGNYYVAGEVSIVEEFLNRNSMNPSFGDIELRVAALMSAPQKSYTSTLPIKDGNSVSIARMLSVIAMGRGFPNPCYRRRGE